MKEKISNLESQKILSEQILHNLHGLRINAEDIMKSLNNMNERIVTVTEEVYDLQDELVNELDAEPENRKRKDECLSMNAELDDLVENLKCFRTKKGLSQKELARRAGLNVNTIQGYESKKYRPKIETRKKLAEILL